MWNLSDMRVRLRHESFWRRLYETKNVMIVHKKGIRIFPPLAYTVARLEPDAQYSVQLGFQNVDKFVYYARNGIYESNEEDGGFSPMICAPEVTQSGRYWMDSDITFSHIKLTHLQSKEPHKITICSRKKYVPFLQFQKVGDPHFCQFYIRITEFITFTGSVDQSYEQLRNQMRIVAKAGSGLPKTWFPPFIWNPEMPIFYPQCYFSTLPLQEVRVPQPVPRLSRRKSDFSIGAILGLDEENENQENLPPMENDDVIVNVVD